MNEASVFSRQLDLVRPSELDFPITVIGAGGIGSWTVLALAKMGCTNLTVFDFDRVEIANTPSQLYTNKFIGEHKVDALKSIVNNLTGVDILGITRKFQELDQELDDVVISAVDSMEERAFIWNNIVQKQTAAQTLKCYIDARMGGELLRVLTVNPNLLPSVQGYLSKIISPQKVHEEVCTAKSIVYNTFICGGLIASLVKKFAKREHMQDDVSFDIANTTTI